jgi:hypothetical protein
VSDQAHTRRDAAVGGVGVSRGGGVRVAGRWACPRRPGERVAWSGVVRELRVMARRPGVEASSGARLGLF